VVLAPVAKVTPVTGGSEFEGFKLLALMLHPHSVAPRCATLFTFARDLYEIVFISSSFFSSSTFVLTV
jgi:hypothetical protein